MAAHSKHARVAKAVAKAAAGVPYRQRICEVLQYVVSIFDNHCHYEATENLERDHRPRHHVKALQMQR